MFTDLITSENYLEIKCMICKELAPKHIRAYFTGVKNTLENLKELTGITAEFLEDQVRCPLCKMGLEDEETH